MEVAKLAAPPNLEVRFVSCNESAIKKWLSSELEETVFSLTHELFMSKHHTVTLSRKKIIDSTAFYAYQYLVVFSIFFTFIYCEHAHVANNIATVSVRSEKQLFFSLCC